MEKNIILCGDCIELIKDLPDESIDMVLTDPPYGIDSNIDISINDSGYSTYNGEWDEVMNFESDIYRVLKNNSIALVFATQHNLFKNGSQLLDTGFEIVNLIKWIKADRFPNISLKYLSHDTEFIIVARKGKENYFNYPYSLIVEDLYSKRGCQLSETWITGKTKGGKRDLHPTQKPNWLIERLIRLYSREEDTILDCFAGSGTTGACCIRLNRHYILMEKEKEFYDTAKKRLDDLHERFDTNLKEFLE